MSNLQDEEDVYILSKISDIIHALFGTMGIDFLPLFDQLLGHFVRLLKSDSPWSDRQWGLCIFDDLLEYAGPVSILFFKSGGGGVCLSRKYSTLHVSSTLCALFL